MEQHIRQFFSQCRTEQVYENIIAILLRIIATLPAIIATLRHILSTSQKIIATFVVNRQSAADNRHFQSPAKNNPAAPAILEATQLLPQFLQRRQGLDRPDFFAYL